MTSTSSHQEMAGSRSFAGARNASILILYFLLSAGMFGGCLLHQVAWVIRCQDAIDMSHTASAFTRTYAGMDVTKAIDLKSFLNSTMTRVLDEKLPALISQACVSDWAYVAIAKAVANIKTAGLLGCLKRKSDTTFSIHDLCCNIRSFHCCLLHPNILFRRSAVWIGAWRLRK